MVRLTSFFFSMQLIGFLIGGIPFAYLVARWRAGIDIRAVGSGNVGATNVGRVLGFRYFALVFLLDLAKGAVPVLLATWLRDRPGELGFSQLEALYFLPEVVGFATILGHLFPVFLNLRGGKGVATTIGVLHVLAPMPLLWGLVAWVLVLIMSRMVSLSSLAFAVFFVLGYFMTCPDLTSKNSLGLTIFVMVVAGMIGVAHRSNIGRIVQGTEPKVRLPWNRAAPRSRAS